MRIRPRVNEVVSAFTCQIMLRGPKHKLGAGIRKYSPKPALWENQMIIRVKFSQL